jgi:hypothetical protein
VDIFATAFFVDFLAVVVGDVILVRAMRKQTPSAFAAAGYPKLADVALFSPALMGQYFSFILTRSFRHHLAPGTSLRLFANVLYSLHVLLFGTVVVGFLTQFASSWVSMSRPT